MGRALSNLASTASTEARRLALSCCSCFRADNICGNAALSKDPLDVIVDSFAE